MLRNRPSAWPLRTGMETATRPVRRVHAPCTQEKHGMAVRLFVGNLPYDVTEAELRAHFAAIGPLCVPLAGHGPRHRQAARVRLRGIQRPGRRRGRDTPPQQSSVQGPTAGGERSARAGRACATACPAALCAAPTGRGGPEHRRRAGTSAPMRRRGAGVRRRSGPRMPSAARSAPSTSARPDLCVSAPETTTVTRRRCAAHTGRVTAPTRARTTPRSGTGSGARAG